MDYKEHIRGVADFPKQGVYFYDITTLLNKPYVFKSVILDMVDRYKGLKIDKVVGMESRGFIFGSLLASSLHCGFVPVRKSGKLPYDKVSESYEKEYGMDALEIHKDAISSGENVLIVDDLLATGGTALATCNLVKCLGGNVIGLSFVIELDFLKGRLKLDKYDVFSLVHYDS